MRISVDTGGTFTDLLLEERDGSLAMFKAPTTPTDPVAGVLAAAGLAAEKTGRSLEELLRGVELFVFGTTHALNAIVTGRAARTAFLTTRGHRDILILREGGRPDAFDFTRPYPKPYVSRKHTWELGGRILADGRELHPFDEGDLQAAVAGMRREGIEAVAVCLLWSIVNPAHELRTGKLLRDAMPSIPVTLSHQLNPVLREFRRASAACVDASLKPLMSTFIDSLGGALAAAGFEGRLAIVTSQGGMMDAADVAKAPIHLVNSGPSMAPVAGRHFALEDVSARSAIVADTGGTTYDVSLVRAGAIPKTNDLWIGEPFHGHFTGLPAVSIKSVGAGGGSIAWVDDARLLRVGPASAGAEPGPACYARGGERPTVTDACVILGYIDPDFFLGGAIPLQAELARRSVDRYVAAPLGLGVEEAAAAILEIVSENMAQAITDLTVSQGVAASDAVLVGGGGAAGLNSVAIARKIGCARLVIPEVGAALSASGAMMSELSSSYRAATFTDSRDFDVAAVEAGLARLQERCRQFIAEAGSGAVEVKITLSVEARYRDEVWEVETPLPAGQPSTPGWLAELIELFHATHEDLFAVRDEGADVEFVSWLATASCRLRSEAWGRLKPSKGRGSTARQAFFPGLGWVAAAVHRLDDMAVASDVPGPALIESPFTTVVINPGAVAQLAPSGSLIVQPRGLQS